MIIKKENINGIDVFTVIKDYDDATMEAKMNTFIQPTDIKHIITKDTDVYTEEGKLLLRFRKNKLSKEKIELFYENIESFSKRKTSNRGSASGSKYKTNSTNPRIMSNIFGFFDRWSPPHKVIFKKNGFKPSINVRECYFNMRYPEKYIQTIPLIKEIDSYYKQYTPNQYAAQRKKADQTVFKITGTSFTTVTTNVNYQTSVHTDKGDDIEGFGNLTVIEKGSPYKGGETCFPQYGIGVDVRSGDVLFMDVHQPHANLAIVPTDETSYRLSIVCYLRKSVWLNTKNKTMKFKKQHNKTIKKQLGGSGIEPFQYNADGGGCYDVQGCF
jgi:hypothetical protein